MSTYFAKRTVGKNSKKIVEFIDPVLHEDPNPELYIITDTYHSEFELRYIKKLINQQAQEKVPVSIIYAYRKKTTPKDLEKGEWNYIREFGTPFAKYIPAGSKILALGKALQSLTRDTDITVHAFYDIVWNKQSFYDPRTRSYVFPADGYWKIANREKMLDNWERFFLYQQIQNVLDFVTPKKRRIQPKLIIETDFVTWAHTHMAQKEVAWDIETSGFSFVDDIIRCITFSFDGKTGYYFEWKDVEPHLELLTEFLKNKYQIGANLKFDVKFLRHRGVHTAKVDFDTLAAGHVLNEMRSNSLKSHAFYYTDHGGYDYDLEVYKTLHPKIKGSYDKIPQNVLYSYATMDSVVNFIIYKKMKKQLAEDPLVENYFYEHVLPSEQMYVDIELEGAHINWDKLESEITPELEQRRLELREQIWKSFGTKIDIDSSQKLGLFLEQRGWPDFGRGKTGVYLTKKDVLREWDKLGYKEATMLLEYNSISTIISTFAGKSKQTTEKRQRAVNLKKKKGAKGVLFGSEDIQSEDKPTGLFKSRHKDGLLHSVFWVMLARSGRNRSSDPNFQNFPKRGALAKLIRSYFTVPSDRYGMAETDYSGLQLRIAAVLSQDPMMLKTFRELGGDIHAMTTQAIYFPDMSIEDFLKVKKDPPYKDKRSPAKNINFGFLFGMGAFAFARNFLGKDWTEEQMLDYIAENNLEVVLDHEDNEDLPLTCARDIREKFFTTYKGLLQWIEDCHAEGVQYGYTRSVHGARRLVPQLLYTEGADCDKGLIAHLKNICVNSRVQNFEAVVIHRAMLKIKNEWERRGIKSRFFSQIHDAMDYYVDLDKKNETYQVVKHFAEMDYPEYDGVPFLVESEHAEPLAQEPSYWGMGKELDDDEFDYDDFDEFYEVG